jgi:hypothetical protein
VSLWMVALPSFLIHSLKYLLAAGSVALTAMMIVKIATTRSILPGNGVSKFWTPGSPPHYDLANRP